MNLLKNITKKIDLPSLPASTQKEVKFSFSIIKDWVTYFTDVLNTVIDFLNTYIARVDDTSYNHIISTEAHGATGAVVGTTNEQTILNKTLTSPKINNIISTTSDGILLESNTGVDIVLFGDSSSDNTIFYGNVTAPTAEFGDSTNKTVFEADGTMVAQGDATTWKDIFFPMGAPKTTGVGAPIRSVWIGNIAGYSFAINDFYDADPQEYSHDGKVGSTATLHIHWVSLTDVAALRYVKWQVEYTQVSPTGVFPATTTVSIEIEIPANTPVGKHFITDIATFTTLGPASFMCIQLKRIAASGTAPGNPPVVLGTHYHYEVDTMGSRAVLTK